MVSLCIRQTSVFEEVPPQSAACLASAAKLAQLLFWFLYETYVTKENYEWIFLSGKLQACTIVGFLFVFLLYFVINCLAESLKC